MKKLATTILACGLLAASLTKASALATMRLSADGGNTWVVVVDNGPFDSSATAGFIHFEGIVGNWYANLATGIGSPIVGSPITPLMELGTDNLSTNAATLIVQMS